MCEGVRGFQERKNLVNFSPPSSAPQTDVLFSTEEMHASSLQVGAFLPDLITSEISSLSFSLFDQQLAATSDTFLPFQQLPIPPVFVKQLMPFSWRSTGEYLPLMSNNKGAKENPPGCMLEEGGLYYALQA